MLKNLLLAVLLTATINAPIPPESAIQMLEWNGVEATYNDEKIKEGFFYDREDNSYGSLVYVKDGKIVDGWNTYDEMVSELRKTDDEKTGQLIIEAKLPKDFNENINVSYRELTEDGDFVAEYKQVLTPSNAYNPSFTVPEGYYELTSVRVDGDFIGEYEFDYDTEIIHVAAGKSDVLSFHLFNSDEELVYGDETKSSKTFNNGLSDVRDNDVDDNVMKEEDKESVTPEVKEEKKRINPVIVVVVVSVASYIIYKILQRKETK